MSDAKDAGSVRDFRNGVPLGDLPDGAMVVGRVDADDVLLARHGDALFATIGRDRTNLGAELKMEREAAFQTR